MSVSESNPAPPSVPTTPKKNGVILQGTLHKEKRGTWRKKLFILDSKSLRIFVKAGDQTPASDSRRSSTRVQQHDEILLGHMSNISMVSDVPGTFSFIANRDGKTERYDLKASAPEEAQKWVDALTTAAGQSTTASTPTPAPAPPAQPSITEEDWLDAEACMVCHAEFGFFRRKHHCRYCGHVICSSCSDNFRPRTALRQRSTDSGEVDNAELVRICDVCHQEHMHLDRKQAMEHEHKHQADPNKMHEGIKHMQALRNKIPGWTYVVNPFKKDLSRGELYLEVMGALSLPAMDVGNSSDPYITMELGEEKTRTTTKTRSLNPIWHEEFLLNVTNTTQILKLSIWDYDSMSEDDLIGTVEIPLQDLAHSVLVDDWFEIKLAPEVIEEQLALLRSNSKALSMALGREKSKPRIHLRMHFTFNKWGNIACHFDAVYPPIPPPPPFNVDDFYKASTRLLWAVLPILNSLANIGYVLQWQSPFLSASILVLFLYCYNYSGLLPVVIQLKILHFMGQYYVHKTCDIKTVSEKERALLTAKDTTDVKAELEKQEIKSKLEAEAEAGKKEEHFNAVLVSMIGNSVGKDWEEWLEWLQGLFAWLADYIEWIANIFCWADFASPIVFGFLCFTTLYSCFFPFGDVAIVIGVFLMVVMTTPGQWFMFLFWGVLHYIQRPVWTDAQLKALRDRTTSTVA